MYFLPNQPNTVIHSLLTFELTSRLTPRTNDLTNPSALSLYVNIIKWENAKANASFLIDSASV